MQRFFPLLIGTLLTIVLSAQEKSPVQWINQTFDYGTVETPAREQAVFEVKNVSGRTVRLSVVKKGRGLEVSPEQLTLQPGQIGAFRAAFETKKRGRFSRQFTVRTPEGHRYTLFIKGRANNPKGQVDECPDLTTNVRYAAPEFSLRVRVLDAATGLPVRGGWVQVEGARGTGRGVTNEEGFYKKTLPVGQYFIRVEKAGYLPADTFGYVNHATRLMRIYLHPAATSRREEENTPIEEPSSPEPIGIALAVKDSLTHAPIKRAAIHLWAANGDYEGKWTTPPDGMVHLRLSPGTYTATVHHRDYPQRRVTLHITPQSTTHTVLLASPKESSALTKSPPPAAPKPSPSPASVPAPSKPAGPVRLQVIRPDGSPVPNVRIQVYQGNHYKGRYAIGRSGRPIVWSEPPDTYRLSLYEPAGRTRWDTTIAVSAQTTLITVLSPPALLAEKPAEKPTESASPLPPQPPITAPDTASALLPPALYSPNNLVFLIDVSSSMRKKMPRLKKALKTLIKALRPHDHVSIITYSTVAAVRTRGISGYEKDSLNRLVDRLTAEGMTYGIRGLRKAYELARENFIENGNNQVILITDGEFNSPDFSRLELFRLIKDNALVPIKLSVVSLAEKQKSGHTLQLAATFGRGSYIPAKDVKKSSLVLLDEVKKQSRKSEDR